MPPVDHSQRSAERQPGRHLYLCHAAHEHDRIYMENMAQALRQFGVPHRVVEFEQPGPRPELLACLDNAIGVVGLNSQLDHCWIEDENFLDVAAQRQVPVIHWIVDHPSGRWLEFGHASAANSCFLLISASCEAYFRRHALADARTAWTAGVGPNWRSRVEGLSRSNFRAREINCLIALNLRRVDRTIEDLEMDRRALPADLRAMVSDAIDLGRQDLENTTEAHLEAALRARGRELGAADFHRCFEIAAHAIHVWRRLKIFDVAERFPVLVQTDASPSSLLSAAAATVRTDAEAVSMPATIARMKSCRSVLTANLAPDMLHDRTANALNAGCVAIVEDTPLHRRLFEHGRNALLFRYDEDSLAECLDLVCHRPRRAWEIAQAGFALRDRAPIRFGGFIHAFDLAR